MIRNKPLRNFRVEVAADSLVQIDEETEKQDRVEFLTAVGAYIGKAAEVGAAAPVLVPLLMELLKFGVTGFKVGKSVEGTIDKALEDLKQKAAQAAMQPPPPNPEIEAQQAKTQAVKEQGAIKVGVAREHAQIEREKMNAERINDMTELQIEGQRAQQEGQMAQQDMQRKQQLGDMQHQQKMRQAMVPPKAKQ
jgi:hypothetical protein